MTIGQTGLMCQVCDLCDWLYISDDYWTDWFDVSRINDLLMRLFCTSDDYLTIGLLCKVYD